MGGAVPASQRANEVALGGVDVWDISLYCWLSLQALEPAVTLISTDPPLPPTIPAVFPPGLNRDLQKVLGLVLPLCFVFFVLTICDYWWMKSDLCRTSGGSGWLCVQQQDRSVVKLLEQQHELGC